MPRATRVPASRKRRKQFIKRAKGFWGGRRKLYHVVRETVQRAEVFATRDRKKRKRAFRSLWIIRVNAACRKNGISYSRFMSGLKRAKVNLDRKSLAELAVRDPKAFQGLVQLAQAK